MNQLEKMPAKRQDHLDRVDTRANRQRICHEGAKVIVFLCAIHPFDHRMEAMSGRTISAKGLQALVDVAKQMRSAKLEPPKGWIPTWCTKTESIIWLHIAELSTDTVPGGRADVR